MQGLGHPGLRVMRVKAQKSVLQLQGVDKEWDRGHLGNSEAAPRDNESFPGKMQVRPGMVEGEERCP